MQPQVTAITLASDADFSGYGAAGFEDITGADLKIPFLKVLQTNTPVCNKRGDDYVPDAEPGKILLTIPETLFDGETGCMFVPAAIQHIYSEQVPFEKGKGFKGVHAVDAPEVLRSIAAYRATEDGKKKPLAKYPNIDNGGATEFIETWQVFGIVVNEETNLPLGAFSLAIKGKGISPFKNWLTPVHQYRHRGTQQVPLYAHVVRLTTYLDTMDNKEFFVPKFSPAFNRQVKDSLVGPGTALFERAKELHNIVLSGRVDQTSYGDADDVIDVPAGDMPF